MIKHKSELVLKALVLLCDPTASSGELVLKNTSPVWPNRARRSSSSMFTLCTVLLALGIDAWAVKAILGQEYSFTFRLSLIRGLEEKIGRTKILKRPSRLNFTGLFDFKSACTIGNAAFVRSYYCVNEGTPSMQTCLEIVILILSSLRECMV